MEELISRFRERYGDAYSFDRVEWEGNKNPVEIVCWDHGPFWVTPDNFLYHRGCPLCSSKPWGRPNTHPRHAEPVQATPGRPKQSNSLYIMSVGDHYIKVGRTRGKVCYREATLDAKCKLPVKAVYRVRYPSAGAAEAIERAIKKTFDMGVVPDGMMLDGATETTLATNKAAIIRIMEAFPGAEVY